VTVNIVELGEQGLTDYLADLTDILHATVNDGASVGFVLPYSQKDGRAFWLNEIKPFVSSGARVLFAAMLEGKVVGTVQLDIIKMPNQQHRCEVAKLLVHPRFRNRGIAKMLMAVLEKCAQERGRHLITLDTRTGDTAEPLYHSLGYKTAGVIPEYCRAPDEERYDSTTYMYKHL
jgi:ribosomal protein S18 acetylase RimI-like enzyme